MKHTPTLVIIVVLVAGIIVFHAVRQRVRRRKRDDVRHLDAGFAEFCDTVAMIRRRQAIIRQAMEPVGEGPP